MTKYLENVNSHPRDANLQFFKDTHTYMVHDVIFHSVTTWVNRLFQEFDKKKCIERMMAGKYWSTHEFYGKTVEEIEEIWDLRNKSAMSEGIRLHEDIENFLNKIEVCNNSIEFQYFKNFVTEHDLHVFRTEWQIYDEELKLAGTIDMCSKNRNGSVNLYDWKRSKSIKRFNNFQFSTLPKLEHVMDTNYNHYALQLNFYRYIIQKRYGLRVENMFIVCFHPVNPNKDYLMYHVPVMDYEMSIITRYIKQENK